MTDDKDSVELSVTSYDPGTKGDVREKTITAFYRSPGAENHTSEGSGHGLYLANFIVHNHLKTQINVSQTPKMVHS